MEQQNKSLREMITYTLPGIRLESEWAIQSFAPFLEKQPSDLPLVRLTVLRQAAQICEDRILASHRGILVEETEDGWMYRLSGRTEFGLRVSRDYRELQAWLPENCGTIEWITPLIRTALECASAAQGVLSLHSACVTLEGRAVCFTASSGTGKSTRAASWESALGAEFLSGDRPSLRLDASGVTACGVPWDGKEQIFRNDQVPLLAICNIQRGDFVRVRKMSAAQARRMLMQQCFIPMWDTDVSIRIMSLIRRMCRQVPIYRVICGPGEEDARSLEQMLYHDRDEIMEVEQDMKIKKGFVLRNTDGEYVVMPTGRNISKFDGAIVLNEVAACIWNRMQDSISREELLEHILAEFEVERARAEQDLDALIAKLRDYGVIDDTV